MARSEILVAALLLALAGSLGTARADATPVAGRAAAAADARPIEAPQLADWGISGRIVTGKIPTLNVAIAVGRVLAGWPKIRAAGLVADAGDAGWARAHPITACQDVALAALPMVLRDLYGADAALDYAPVYGECDAGVAPQPLFSLNVNRAIVRRLRGGPELAARVVLSPSAQAEIRREQR